MSTRGQAHHRGVSPPAPRLDWDYWIALRPLVLAEQPAAPRYYLLLEVQTLLAGAESEPAHLLIDTLWHTGARISEPLALTPRDLLLAAPPRRPMIRVPRGKRRAGRPRRQTSLARHVPVHVDPDYVARLARYAHGRRAAALRARAATLRHAFAVHQCLHHRPEAAIQAWLGHRDAATTRLYLRLLSLDTADLMYGVSYER